MKPILPNLRQLRAFIPASLFCLLFFTPTTSFGQKAESDSLTALYKKRANKAALYSALLPGAGQVYNKKYWKVPILAAGFGTLIYFIDFNNDYYQEYKTAYANRIDGDSLTTDNYPNYTVNDLSVRKDYYRRNRDLCIILVGGVYVLNIIDAYVDAQLKGFDISDNLSMKISPSLQLSRDIEPISGLRVTFTFP